MTEGEFGLERFINRELSWLEFDSRVLELAEDAALPLLERVKFLAIASRNLDEFFQVRVALLIGDYASVDVVSQGGMSRREQLDRIRECVMELVAREEALFESELVPALAREGIAICDWADLSDEHRKELRHAYDERVLPALTPLAVDPSHPFPYVSNLSLNLAVTLRDPEAESARFARIKIPPFFDRFLPCDDGQRFVPLEQVIGAHLDRLFPGIEVEASGAFRVTRDADLELEEGEADDLLAAVESSLNRRRRTSDAVRVEVADGLPQSVRQLLLDELELEAADLYPRRSPIDLSGLFQIASLDRPELRDPVWKPRPLPRGDGESASLFARMRLGDLFVHHPYESFESSVEAFLAEAASDPDVLAIKHTIYRSSGPENPIGKTIIRAAEAGKQVLTLVELKARFDEATNIGWARTLEEAGVHVVYGLVGLKTHAKTVLVVRREGDRIRRYCHIGTGNYNPATARLYEDIGLMTADPVIGEDLSELFNHMSGLSRLPEPRKLLVAPMHLRGALLERIEKETHAPDGRIVAKVNSLSDEKLIDALYRASQAGVEIDLIVRGICSLRPGVPGLSEKIRVRSVLGRYLEHSRVFRFGSPARGHRYYMGSADWMPRNLDRRVEVITPIEAPASQARIDEIFTALLGDDTGAWELRDDSWQRVPVVAGRSAQRELYEAARARGESAGDSVES